MFEQNIILTIPVLFFAMVIHEFAHGWMALKCGDDTAYLSGRLTLNPLPHIDPLGTILLPALLIISGSPFIFGWAKPVPVNPYKFYDPKRDMMKVGLSGPASNFIVAVLSALLMWILKYANIIPQTVQGAQLLKLIAQLLYLSVWINLILAVFNLIPVPPLDGSRVLSGLLPDKLAYEYDKLSPYGFFIIIFLFYTRILDLIISPIIDFLLRLLLKGIFF